MFHYMNLICLERMDEVNDHCFGQPLHLSNYMRVSCHLASCHTCTCDPSVISNIAFISCRIVATYSLMIYLRSATHLCAFNNLVIVHPNRGYTCQTIFFPPPKMGAAPTTLIFARGALYDESKARYY